MHSLTGVTLNGLLIFGQSMVVKKGVEQDGSEGQARMCDGFGRQKRLIDATELVANH